MKSLAAGRPEGWFIGGVHPVEDWVEDFYAHCIIPQDFKQNCLETSRLSFSRNGSFRSNPDDGQIQEENKNSVSSMNYNTND